MGFSKLNFYKSVLIACSIIIFLSCSDDTVFSSGKISFDISGLRISYDENIQGQFYTNTNNSNGKENYGYMFTSWGLDNCCLLFVRTLSEDKNQVTYADEELKSSSIAFPEIAREPLSKAGNYIFDHGVFEITSKGKNAMNAEFDLFFVDKKTRLDTVHISNGQLLVRDLEHHYTSYN